MAKVERRITAPWPLALALAVACGDSSSTAPDAGASGPQADAGAGDVTTSGGPDANADDASRSDVDATPDVGTTADAPATRHCTFAGSASAQVMSIPMYIDPPSAEWDSAIQSPSVGLLIANAGNPGGPGTTPAAGYTTVIDAAHAHGKKVIGYVDTNFTKVAAAAAGADIDTWYAFYPAIDGIFLDQASPDAASVTSYYTALSAKIRAKPGAHVVVANPGQTQIDETWMTISDVVMNFENPYASAGDGYGPGAYAAPPWTTKYDPSHFWHVVLEVPSAQLTAVLDLACARRAGHVYVTDYADPPAYTKLPSYFGAEEAYLK